MNVDESLESVSRNKKLHPEVIRFMRILVKGTAENMDEIDRLLTDNAENWTLNRMATVDRNILRIGTYEIMKMADIPVNVIINEAIEIAKNYSTLASSKFINGILDKLKNVRGKV
jgi:N utilization substance protein B